MAHAAGARVVNELIAHATAQGAQAGPDLGQARGGAVELAEVGERGLLAVQLAGEALNVGQACGRV